MIVGLSRVLGCDARRTLAIAVLGLRALAFLECSGSCGFKSYGCGFWVWGLRVIGLTVAVLQCLGAPRCRFRGHPAPMIPSERRHWRICGSRQQWKLVYSWERCQGSLMILLPTRMKH